MKSGPEPIHRSIEAIIDSVKALGSAVSGGRTSDRDDRLAELKQDWVNEAHWRQRTQSFSEAELRSLHKACEAFYRQMARLAAHGTSVERLTGRLAVLSGPINEELSLRLAAQIPALLEERPEWRVLLELGVSVAPAAPGCRAMISVMSSDRPNRPDTKRFDAGTLREALEKLYAATSVPGTVVLASEEGPVLARTKDTWIPVAWDEEQHVWLPTTAAASASGRAKQARREEGAAQGGDPLPE